MKTYSPKYLTIDVNEKGEVFRNGEISTPSTNANGYQVINFQRKPYSVHRLVALKYIPNPDNLEMVDHINGDPSDNRVENLRWVSRSQNIRNTSFIRKGGKRARLTVEQVRAIRADDRAYHVIAQDYPVNGSQVGAIKRRDCWKHVI